jgi:hypothetical protein
MRCKHCGLTFQARARAVPGVPNAAPARPGADLARTPLPAARAGAASPFADLAAPAAPPPAGGSSFRFDFDQAPAARPARRRRRSSAGCWTALFLGVLLLAVSVGASAIAWPYLSRLAQESNQLALNPDGEEENQPAAQPVSRPAETAPRKPVETAPARSTEPLPKRATEPEPRKPVDTAPARPVETPRPPRKPPEESPRKPTETPPSAGRFPRRALIVSVNNYLYFNPVQYGLLSPAGRNVHNLANKLNLGLHIPLDQVFELSDAAPESRRGGQAARSPLKSVIEQTVTDFLQTSRAQDRIVLMFIGHAVEVDGETFLVPIDGERDNKANLIPLSWLYEKLAASRARQKVLILDVCRFDPSRGFERPGSGSPDAKVEGTMTAKMDEALKNPPAGVEVWSACVAEQYSHEYEEDGVFVDALLKGAGQPIEGVIQRPADSIRVDKLVEIVNKEMGSTLSLYGKKQTSRLAGTEPEDGAAYDPAEPPPPRVEPKPPVAAADAYPVAELRKLLKEVDLPPIKVAREEMLLRAESLPPFTARTMAAYKEGEGADTPLRKAVKAAIEALGQLKGKTLREEWSAPADENRFKAQVTDYQKAEVARVQRELDEALADLKSAGTPEARAAEPRRWQAHYDYVLARLEAELAYLNEYQGLLGQLKKELPPIDKKVQNGWRVASQKSLSDSTAKKLAKDAEKTLDKIVKDYPDTPWQILAKRDRMTALGMEWQAARLGQ